jgi:hypothetical protein
MSRGHGYVQRFVLAELDRQWAIGDPWVDAMTLAERLVGATPSMQARRSVRRALRLLAADGLVEIASCSGTRHESPSRPTHIGNRASVIGRVALARVDDVALRDARRADARQLRRQLREVCGQDRPRQVGMGYSMEITGGSR